MPVPQTLCGARTETPQPGVIFDVDDQLPEDALSHADALARYEHARDQWSASARPHTSQPVLNGLYRAAQWLRVDRVAVALLAQLDRGPLRVHDLLRFPPGDPVRCDRLSPSCNRWQCAAVGTCAFTKAAEYETAAYGDGRSAEFWVPGAESAIADTLGILLRCGVLKTFYRGRELWFARTDRRPLAFLGE